MLSRRQFMELNLKGSSLLALGATVPSFLARTAQAAEVDKEHVLVVVELTGGNDGLNTVIPYADDEYYKARPTLGIEKKSVLKLNDDVGLHPALEGLKDLYDEGSLSVVQGIGYPNPNRSHFESMDIWHSADPRRKNRTGWLGRSLNQLTEAGGGIPAFHIAKDQLPLALKGSATGIPTLHPDREFGLQLGGASGRNVGARIRDGELLKRGRQSAAVEERKKLIRELTELPSDSSNDLLKFVQRTSVQTYSTIDRLNKIVKGFEKPQGEFEFRGAGKYGYVREGLAYELQLVARMIEAGFGTRIFYVSLDGFDTHSDQADAHRELLKTLGDSVAGFYQQLKSSGHDKRVVLMTFSEFGRRVRENGSKGTDHGAASCLFVAGPAVKEGVVGAHPGLAANELSGGDPKYHTDFRRVYATVLEKWLECDGTEVLGQRFDHVKLFG